MNLLIYVIFIILYLGVTFFGLGPVLIADGSTKERMLILGIVVLLYVILTFIFLKWKKRK